MPSSAGSDATPPVGLSSGTILFAITLLPLGGFLCYYGSAWAAFISAPSGQLSARQSANVLELEILGIALIVAAVGLLRIRRWAWILALVVLNYGLMRWLVWGTGTMVFEAHGATAGWWIELGVKRILVPIALSLLLTRFLASDANRKLFTAQTVSLPWVIAIPASAALLYTLLWNLIPASVQS